MPLKKGQDISGHICQGHVDGTAKLINKFKKDKAMIFEFSVKKNIINQLVNKASILINGVSLTVSKILKYKKVSFIDTSIVGVLSASFIALIVNFFFSFK